MQSQAIDFHPPIDAAAKVLLPDLATLFSARAERFAHLAQAHSLGEWLGFLERLTRAQHHALATLGALDLPDAASRQRSREHGMPMLDVNHRPPFWRLVLRQMAGELMASAPGNARSTLAALMAADEARLEQLADALLGGAIESADVAELPFVAAALQVAYSALASQLDAGQLQPLDIRSACPCCGSPPVASIVRLGSTINNLRYLHCSLCNSQWNIARAVCSNCDSDQGVALFELEGQAGKPGAAVRAETCDACKSYLKIVYQDKDPLVDPVADDLATLALDMLVDEAGYERSGPNLLMIATSND